MPQTRYHSGILPHLHGSPADSTAILQLYPNYLLFNSFIADSSLFQNKAMISKSFIIYFHSCYSYVSKDFPPAYSISRKISKKVTAILVYQTFSLESLKNIRQYFKTIWHLCSVLFILFDCFYPICAHYTNYITPPDKKNFLISFSTLSNAMV